MAEGKAQPDVPARSRSQFCFERQGNSNRPAAGHATFRRLWLSCSLARYGGAWGAKPPGGHFPSPVVVSISSNSEWILMFHSRSLNSRKVYFYSALLRLLKWLPQIDKCRLRIANQALVRMRGWPRALLLRIWAPHVTVWELR